MKNVAEYFQITVPYKKKQDDDGNEWQSVESSHIKESGMQHNPAEDQKFNQMPRTDVEVHEQRSRFVQGFGGNTDVSSVSAFADIPKLFEQGYKRREMKATDDQYSGEHIDLFYGEAVDEKGLVGFAERNNYLDRI
jgi:hypothetical protein